MSDNVLSSLKTGLEDCADCMREAQEKNRELCHEATITAVTALGDGLTETAGRAAELKETCKQILAATKETIDLKTNNGVEDNQKWQQ